MARIKPLDSLRGIAAFTVLLAQCYSIWPEDLRDQLLWLNHTPLRFLINGHAAVTLFFVLSGYVLALPFFTGRGGTYGQFVVRRLCRIYIPFAMAILGSVLLFYISGGQPSADGSLWFNDKWVNGFGFMDVGLHLLMTGRSQDMALNHNMWTLVYELRISLIFPLLVALAMRKSLAAIFTLLLFAICTIAMVNLSAYSDEFFIDTPSFAFTFLITGRLIAFFMVGILLAQNQEAILARLRQASLVWQSLLWGLCGAIWIAPHFPEEDVLQAIPAALAILLVQVQPNVGAWLSSGPTAWLGRVSYSLYLVQLPILFALFHSLLGKLPFGVIAGIGIVSSLLAAEFMHVLVELPATRLGRRLTADPTVTPYE